jgi:transposase
MIRTHKIRLQPTSEQANYFARAAGTSRFVWNWALAEWNRQYEAGGKPTAFKLKKQFNEMRREQYPLLDARVEQRGGRVIKVGRFFPSSKTCHACGWKWEGMELSDRIFLCQNPTCAYHLFPQDRDYNASLNILYEALHLIGLLDQAVSGTGSDADLIKTLTKIDIKSRMGV